MSHPLLGRDDVHVMTADVDLRPEQLEGLAALLSDEERVRAGRFSFPRDRDRYTATQGILRRALGGYLAVAPDRIRLETLDQGKPVLAGKSSRVDLRFNVAHSDGRAAYAFALGREVGIDIEKIVPRDDLNSLASRFFATEEVEVLAGLEGDQWLKGFYNCWTRKEALLKARGDGLTIPLDQFVVSIRPGDKVRVVEAASRIRDLLDLDLEAIDAGSAFIGAVAFERGANLIQRASQTGSGTLKEG